MIRVLRSHLYRSTAVNSLFKHGDYRTLSSSIHARDSSNDDQASLSKRQLFRAVNPDMKLLEHYDEINLGFLTKRRTRFAAAKRLELSPRGGNPKTEKQRRSVVSTEAIPFPFRATGKVLHSCADAVAIPKAFPGLPPEVALIGRSNVGKSTLLNALVGFDDSFIQKAIVSDKPGETKYLTFFMLGSCYRPPPPPGSEQEKLIAAFVKHNFSNSANKLSVEAEAEKKRKEKLQQLNKEGKGNEGRKNNIEGGAVDQLERESLDKLVRTPALMLVDMPGYGFAFMDETERVRCHMLCMDYLINNNERSKALKRVILLVDGRHGVKATDIMFLEDLQRHLVHKLNDPSHASITKLNTSSRGISTRSVVVPEFAPGTDEFIEKLTAKQMKLLSSHLGWKLQIVMTKCDLVDRMELCRRVTETEASVHEKLPPMFRSMLLPTLALSSKQCRGVEQLQRDLAGLVPAKWDGAAAMNIQLKEAALAAAKKAARKASNKPAHQKHISGATRAASILDEFAPEPIKSDKKQERAWGDALLSKPRKTTLNSAERKELAKTMKAKDKLLRPGSPWDRGGQNPFLDEQELAAREELDAARKGRRTLGAGRGLLGPGSDGGGRSGDEYEDESPAIARARKVFQAVQDFEDARSGGRGSSGSGGSGGSSSNKVVSRESRKARRAAANAMAAGAKEPLARHLPRRSAAERRNDRDFSKALRAFADEDDGEFDGLLNDFEGDGEDEDDQEAWDGSDGARRRAGGGRLVHGNDYKDDDLGDDDFGDALEMDEDDYQRQLRDSMTDQAPGAKRRRIVVSRRRSAAEMKGTVAGVAAAGRFNKMNNRDIAYKPSSTPWTRNSSSKKKK
jgi:GTP-binding protein EngB required for normal cell division